MILFKKKLLLGVLLLALPFPLFAGPWINVGDSQLRHHVQVLADAGIVNVPISTWPLMWSGVIADIESWEAGIEKPNQQFYPDFIPQSIAYVKKAYRQQTQSIRNEIELNLRDEINLQPDFGDKQREEQLYSLATEVMNDWTSLKLRASYAPDAFDEKEYRLDGSYLAAILGNWAVSIGAIDRWWGPGWQSSMILSNSARPAPGFALQRNYSNASNLPVLKWLGPWQLVMFASQLESDRFVPDAKLLGMRVSFRPGKAFELGLSRTAQWGGEGRPENFDSLLDLALGKDNAGSDGITKSNEPGNQLAGIDFRLNHVLLNQQLAIYGQIIGEDEADYFPSRRIVMAGLETAFSLFNRQNRVAIEYSDSTASGYKGDPLYNYAYEHGIYRTGYRYQGRPIGYALDNDSTQTTLSGKHFFLHKKNIAWSFSKANLNKDGNKVNIGGHVWVNNPTAFSYADVAFIVEFKGSVKIELGAKHYFHVSAAPYDIFTDTQPYLQVVVSSF